MVFFPYPNGKSEIRLPKKGEEYLPITAKCYLHSEEYNETIACYECNADFEKRLGIVYLVVTSYVPYTAPVLLGNEKSAPSCVGTIMGDVHSVKETPGKDRTVYMARLAIRDTTTPVGFSYISVSSLHPFTVGKGDHLCVRGKLVSSQRCLNLICPECGQPSSLMIDSVILHAMAVQSLNTLSGYFGEPENTPRD